MPKKVEVGDEVVYDGAVWKVVDVGKEYAMLERQDDSILVPVKKLQKKEGK